MRHASPGGINSNFDRSDIALSLVMLLGLALPFLPLLGDRWARMEVHFHAPGMEAPRAFSVPTTQSTCALFASAVEYEHPDSGHFTRVACEG